MQDRVGSHVTGNSIDKSLRSVETKGSSGSHNRQFQPEVLVWKWTPLKNTSALWTLRRNGSAFGTSVVTAQAHELWLLRRRTSCGYCAGAQVVVTAQAHELWLLRRRTSSHQFKCVRFLVFAAVTMKNVAFWDVTPCGSYKNRRFGGA
jgi:hypothetical protein